MTADVCYTFDDPQLEAYFHSMFECVCASSSMCPSVTQKVSCFQACWTGQRTLLIEMSNRYQRPGSELVVGINCEFVLSCERVVSSVAPDELSAPSLCKQQVLTGRVTRN